MVQLVLLRGCQLVLVHLHNDSKVTDWLMYAFCLQALHTIQRGICFYNVHDDCHQKWTRACQSTWLYAQSCQGLAAPPPSPCRWSCI